ncbi:MAG: hypothetical protein CMI03_18280 [Oceanospirillaceae bacterium]|uniref:putative bifunctional diguanylate cyclase/phosphodiesterase n=1 Tax=unclassified Thalassolituus TaxID=2624967 RepID=UPI000C3982F4|nr:MULTISPECIES: GGDEF and EAL domain-containing protein [unclassified Thalassolituus]MBS54690.1 hypothetical protein [Oceanospirillaceae bacterium]
MPQENGNQSTARQHQPLIISRYNLLLEKLLIGETIDNLLLELACLIQEKQPDCISAVMTCSDDGKSMRCAAGPQLPTGLRQSLNLVSLSEDENPFTQVATARQMILSGELSEKSDPFSILAYNEGIKGCWAQPVISTKGELLGAFALMPLSRPHPTGHDLLLIHECARLAQLIMEFRAAEKHRALTEAITQHLPVGVLVTDGDFNLVDVNPAFTQITGYSLQESVGQRPSFFLNNDRTQLTRYIDIIRALPAGKNWSGEAIAARRNGEHFTAELSFTVIRNERDEVERCIVLFSDISERKRSEEMIQYQASYDLLTSLPNRNLFYEKLNWMLEQCRHRNCNFAVLLLDLDYFKEINDTLGHDAGDELLVKVATRLRQMLPEKNIVARLGGDEFGFIITTDTSTEGLSALADKLLATVSKSVSIRQARDLRISASIGISRYPEDGATLEQLLKATEQAAYSAKHRGRNLHTFFTPVMQEEAKNYAMIHQDLRHAVKENQLILHYQPIKDLASGKITQLEALVRWRHPQRGLVPPDVFIPVAEKTGTIREIGEWVRAEALRLSARLHSMNLLIPIAVNVSTAEFYDHQLAEHIIEQEQASGLPRGNLMVEITESLLIRSQQETIQFLQKLQQAGIRVALDDFGTGYSSLSYLAAFPADKLKIDRSFIQNMTRDQRSMALVDAIINMGHSLHMRIIAEGVETCEDEEILRQKGCDLIQGYWLSKPRPDNEIIDLLLQQTSVQ